MPRFRELGSWRGPGSTHHTLSETLSSAGGANSAWAPPAPSVNASRDALERAGRSPAGGERHDAVDIQASDAPWESAWLLCFPGFLSPTHRRRPVNAGARPKTTRHSPASLTPTTPRIRAVFLDITTMARQGLESPASGASWPAGGNQQRVRGSIHGSRPA